MNKVFGIERPLRIAGALSLIAVLTLVFVDDNTATQKNDTEYVAQR